MFNNRSSLGNYSYIGKNCAISASDIGKYCSIAPNVGIGLGEHDLSLTTSNKIKKQELIKCRTVIQDEVWIGFGAYIRQGVTVGQGAVIAANSVVTKDVRPYEVVAGSPARTIKVRFPKSTIARLLSEISYEDQPDVILSKISGILND